MNIENIILKNKWLRRCPGHMKITEKGMIVMKLDIQTIVIILGLIFVTQVIALFVQYRFNRVYRGVGWWLIGSILMALGFIFISLITVKSLEMLARVAQLLVVLGQIFLYIGIIRFLNKKESRWITISIFSAFVFFYYYYMYVNNDISSRTIVVTAVLAIVSFMSAYKLYFRKDRLSSESANFTSAIFLLYGCFYIVRSFFAIMLPPIQSYYDQWTIVILAFIVPIIASNLWTFGFIIMVNQRLNIENRLEKEKFQQIFNTSPDAYLITRLEDGLFIDVNVGFTVMTGYTHAEVIGETIFNINIWNNINQRQVFINKLNEEGKCKNMEFIFNRRDGSEFVGMISARIIIIYDVPHIISVVNDITMRKQIEIKLMESEETYRTMLNASPDDITITDLDGNILMISQAAKKMFGYEANYDKFIGMKVLGFIVPEDIERAKANILLMYKSDYSNPNEYRGVRKDKSIFDMEINSEFVRNSDGQPSKMVFIIRDITERKLAEQKIQQLVEQLKIERNIAELNSITDSLTGLYNRRYFDEALRTEFSRLQHSGSALSLIMLDVDYFKNFNDRYGHLAGDDCLRQIGTTLKNTVAGMHYIASRYGGEEFIVILPETEANFAKAFAEQIREEVEGLNIPHCESNISEYVTVSIGVVTVFVAKLDAPEQIVALADEALYCAKKGGRNRVEVSALE